MWSWVRNLILWKPSFCFKIKMTLTLNWFLTRMKWSKNSCHSPLYSGSWDFLVPRTHSRGHLRAGAQQLACGLASNVYYKIVMFYYILVSTYTVYVMTPQSNWKIYKGKTNKNKKKGDCSEAALWCTHTTQLPWTRSKAGERSLVQAEWIHKMNSHV